MGGVRFLDESTFFVVRDVVRDGVKGKELQFGSSFLEEMSAIAARLNKLGLIDPIPAFFSAYSDINYVQPLPNRSRTY